MREPRRGSAPIAIEAPLVAIYDGAMIRMGVAGAGLLAAGRDRQW